MAPYNMYVLRFKFCFTLISQIYAIGRIWQHKHMKISLIKCICVDPALREVDTKELESLVYVLGQLCCWTNATLIPH